MSCVLLHGLGQTAHSWAQTLAFWTPREPVLCPDLARLTSDRPIGYESLYRAFCRYCKEDTGPLHLCGLSLGAVLALHYALEHPGQVRSLVLIAPQYHMPTGLLRLQSLIFRLLPRSAFPPSGFGREDFIHLSHTMAKLDLTPSPSALSCPTLILCGGRDRANRKAALGLADRIPHARCVVVEGGDHELNLERPEQLAALLKDFEQTAFAPS